jgi:hypothetical protein
MYTMSDLVQKINQEEVNRILIKQQKQLADTILQKLEAADPDAICAGGAPRDWFFDKPARDIDIFMYQGSEYCTMNNIGRKLKACGFDVSMKGFSADEFTAVYQKNPDIRAVYNVNCSDGTTTTTPVQIIVMKKSTYSLLDSFPLSICKVWYKDGYVNTTTDFDITVASNVMFRTCKGYANSDEYIQKVQVKYPEFCKIRSFTDYPVETPEQLHRLRKMLYDYIAHNYIRKLVSRELMSVNSKE